MAREFVLFVLEGSYQTPLVPTLAEMWTTTGTGTAGAGVAGFVGFYGRLDGGDGFTMRPRPVPVSVPYGGGEAIDAFTVSDKIVCDGKYTTKLYAGPFTQFLLTWASQQINTGGFVGPSGTSTGWAYSSGPPGNLASVYIFHAIQLASGAYKCRGYPGVRVRGWNLSISQDSQIGTLSMDLTGTYPVGNQWVIGNSVDPTLQAFANPATAPTFNTTTTPSTFCAPATPNLPINPYLFINASNTGGSGSAGFLQIGSGALTARTQFQSVAMSCTNKLMPRYWANRSVQFSQFCGRSVTLTAQNFLTNVPDDRTAYEGLVGQSISFSLSNGTHSASFVLNTNNIMTTFEDSLPLDDIYTQTLTAKSQWDPAYAQTDAALAADFQMAFT